MIEEIVSYNECKDLVHSRNINNKKPILPKDLKEIKDDNENYCKLESLSISMNSEKEVIEYYTKIKENLNDSEVIKIIDEIIEQEKNHYSILEGEFNHINSTGYWFELDYLGN